MSAWDELTETWNPKRLVKLFLIYVGIAVISGLLFIVGCLAYALFCPC